MLNNPLLRALVDLFGEPKGVLNEGIQGSYTLPQRKGGCFARKAKLYAHVDDWGEVYSFDCPECDDNRGRLYVSYFTGESVKSKSPAGTFHFGFVYDCKNEHCNLRGYFNKLNIDRSNTEEPAITVKPSTHIRYTRMPSEFPENSIPIISSDVPAYVTEYLRERKFGPIFLDKHFTIRFVPKGSIYQHANAEEGKYERRFKEDRLLIPIIQGGDCISWQARIIGEVTEEKKKYIFPIGCKKSSWLYNMDNAKFRSDLVIVEGVTDVWRVGENAIGIFGKNPSAMQIEMMKHLWGFNGSCVILLDSDAKAESNKLADKLRKLKIFPRGVASLMLDEGKDPAMYSTEELAALIEKARENCE